MKSNYTVMWNDIDLTNLVNKIQFPSYERGSDGIFITSNLIIVFQNDVVIHKLIQDQIFTQQNVFNNALSTPYTFTLSLGHPPYLDDLNGLGKRIEKCAIREVNYGGLDDSNTDIVVEIGSPFHTQKLPDLN